MSDSSAAAMSERVRGGEEGRIKFFMESLAAEGVDVRMVRGDGFVYLETPGAIYGTAQKDLEKVKSAKRKRLVPGFEPESSLFIEDDSLHFDYGHVLPHSKACSVLHGHSSRVSVELFGEVKGNGMILDFGDAKAKVKETLKMVDHKFIVGRRHVLELTDKAARVKFEGPNGVFDLRLPPNQLIALDSEATSENIANFIADRLMEALPPEVKAIKLFFFEGVNKGAASFRVVRD